jgi:galactokinase
MVGGFYGSCRRVHVFHVKKEIKLRRMMHPRQSAVAKFRQLFNEQPLLVRSPGRVNLIGEHTDYNMGFVLPAAIEKSIYFAIGARTDGTSHLFSLDMNDSHIFSEKELHHSEKGWPNYLLGVVQQLRMAGHLVPGFNCVFGGNIPIGAGLASSAALEAGLVFALNRLFELNIDDLTLAKLTQKAENEFVGVQCGIMDQYINIFGREEHVLQLDCRSLQHQYFQFSGDVSIVLFDTCVSHSLASSEYNRRRVECSEGVRIIQKLFPDVTHLRDVTSQMLAECKSRLPELIFRRCKYVIEENQRVLDACQALEAQDLKTFGGYMMQSHEGLSHEYEVSCRELDFLVEVVKDVPAVYGSRMMGGGFGGCTINLVENNAVQEVTKMVAEKYKEGCKIDLKTYITSISSGTCILAEKDHANA